MFGSVIDLPVSMSEGCRALLASIDASCSVTLVEKGNAERFWGLTTLSENPTSKKVKK